ncbi:MAG: transcription-repair coupling factor [Pseudomonadota bacterium]
MKTPASSSLQQPWHNLLEPAPNLAIARATLQYQDVILVITADVATALELEASLKFFTPKTPILYFPDGETLPYDRFSPHADIISRRLEILSTLPHLKQGVIIVPINTLMHRLPPYEFIAQNTLSLHVNQTLEIDSFRQALEKAGYRTVSQVISHGEFTLRGSIIDLFPMGSNVPFRIDLLDNKIDSIRTFDTDTQRSIETIDKISLLPTHEIPLHHQSIQLFNAQWAQEFKHDPHHCSLFEDTINGYYSAGIEYYLPLFFEKTSVLFDYLPKNTLMIYHHNISDAAETFSNEFQARFEALRHDIARPILPPSKLCIPYHEIQTKLRHAIALTETTRTLPALAIDRNQTHPLINLENFLHQQHSRVLFCAETAGRQETLIELLKTIRMMPTRVATWLDFLHSTERYCITVSSLNNGFQLSDVALITESELFGEQVLQKRRRKKSNTYPEQIFQNLNELKIDDPIVHVSHGVGRYRGLTTITVDQNTNEYLVIEYADQDKLFVPISSLQLISRYSSHNIENAPLHKLGSHQWDKVKHKAAEKIRDVAAELLEIYARRAMQTGHIFSIPQPQYLTFEKAFPFEETPDQQNAIEQVLADMQASKPMDRLICGDVGFGKTEVAIRAAFIATYNNKQVAFLVPTTLLAQQHYDTFKDRFANYPVNIEMLSRFRSKKEQGHILKQLAAGKIDIIIGTHRLIQADIKFKSLGLLVIDEEHRFGVHHKERLKSMRSHVDILALTATPIPRTLNMAFAGIRDLSLIATPPKNRLSIKTFVMENKKEIIREALIRELMRGGQVYVLHNDIQTIQEAAKRITQLVPEAKVGVAHAQMNEHQLEQMMTDFYHHRFNVLVCTTIIESGIDIPSANTIIIERADKLGLAQLHQLRGRVGRSHHQAYAYLITPPKKSITHDAQKRLDAIESLEELGIGFTLATHDMEIRGTGELLGKEQSGHMQEIGSYLYMEMLERTIKKLKSGKISENPLDDEALEIDLKICALIPEAYLPDPHQRLILYKRIANAKNSDALADLRVEMIDRFGLLSEPIQNLFDVTELKLKAEKLGIQKIKLQQKYVTIEFNENPNIDSGKLIHLVQAHPSQYQFASNTRVKIITSFEHKNERIKIISDFLSLLR